MVGGEIGGGEEDGGGSFDEREGVAPGEDGGAGLLGGASSFADEQAEEFAESLHGQEGSAFGEFFEELQRGLFHRRAIYAFGVGEDVGVER